MRALATLLALLLAAGCGREGADEPEAQGALRLREVVASGIDAVQVSGHVPASQILEVKGGGIALVDVDVDGLLDVFVPNGATLEEPHAGPGARLYRNLGGLRFEDATAAVGLELARWGFGAIAGDVDGDGRDDVFVACFGRDALLRNRDGLLREDERAADWGERWSTSASFGDLDGDGMLDLYVTRYLAFDPAQPPPPMDFLGVQVFAGPMGLPAVADAVYRNRGDGTFEDASDAWGFAAVEPSYGLGAVILDFDGDGAPEVFVGNDSRANFLFRRVSSDPLRFEDVGLASGIALNEEGAGQATMGIAIADVTGNGLPDVFTTNFMSDTNTLHANAGKLRFEDRTRALGLAHDSRPYLGWGAAFLDLDHDGVEELLLVNGHVYPREITEPAGWRHRQEPLLYSRDGARFSRVAASEAGDWLAAAHQDRGLAVGDLDRDGDLDLVVAELGRPPRVLENVGARGAWLVVELADRRSGVGNRRGIGARVELEAGGKRQVRWIASGTSYMSSSQPAAHFGLGAHDGALTLRVRWPDGHEQRVELERASRHVLVER